MKAIVNQDTCIGCGMCIGTCPGVFSYNNDGKAVAIDENIPEELISTAEEGRDLCPVAAIDISDN